MEIEVTLVIEQSPPIVVELSARQGITGPKGDKGDDGDKGDKGDQGDPGTTDYTELENVPTEFPPESHTHASADITDASTGGNGVADVGKLAKFALDGTLVASQFSTTSPTADGTSALGDGQVSYSKDGTYAVYQRGDNITDDRTIQAPDSSGITAITTRSDGIPDDLNPATGTEATLRTRLGLGNSATRNVGTASTDVAAGDVIQGGPWEAMLQIGRYFRPVTYGFGNSGGSAMARAGDGAFSILSGTAANTYGRGTFGRGLTTPSAWSGAAIDFSRPMACAMRLSLQSGTSNEAGRIRLIFGGNGAVPAVASADALTTRGYGCEFANVGGVCSVRLFGHNGSAYITHGAWASLGAVGSLNNVAILVVSDGAGNLTLYGVGDFRSRMTQLQTLAGGPTLITGAGQCVDLVAVAPASGTLTTAVGAFVFDALFYTA